MIGVTVAALLCYACAAMAAFGNAMANVMQRKASLAGRPTPGSGYT